MTAAREGMDAAERAERVQEWKAKAEAWLAAKYAGDIFSADDLVEAIGLPDEGVARNNVVGAWMAAKSRHGTITFRSFTRSRRVIGHGNLQRVWKVA